MIIRHEVNLKESERIDDLERNGYGIIQRAGAFCFGMDAVLLSGFAGVKPGGMAMDLGTGTGIIPLLLSAKTGGRLFYGIEIQPDMADMASRSVVLNGLEDRIKIIEGDLRLLNRQKELAGAFDTVTSNPPYIKADHGLKNPSDEKAVSRHEISCSLADVCGAAAFLLKSGGHFYLVHRPKRLAEIITELKKVKLEPKRIKPVYPFMDKDANMILIDAVKGGGEECKVERPVIVYDSDGEYTVEVRNIYED